MCSDVGEMKAMLVVYQLSVENASFSVVAGKAVEEGWD